MSLELYYGNAPYMFEGQSLMGWDNLDIDDKDWDALLSNEDDINGLFDILQSIDVANDEVLKKWQESDKIFQADMLLSDVDGLQKYEIHRPYYLCYAICVIAEFLAARRKEFQELGVQDIQAIYDNESTIWASLVRNAMFIADDGKTHLFDENGNLFNTFTKIKIKESSGGFKDKNGDYNLPDIFDIFVNSNIDQKYIKRFIYLMFYQPSAVPMLDDLYNLLILPSQKYDTSVWENAWTERWERGVEPVFYGLVREEKKKKVNVEQVEAVRINFLDHYQALYFYNKRTYDWDSHKDEIMDYCYMHYFLTKVNELVSGNSNAANKFNILLKNYYSDFQKKLAKKIHKFDVLQNIYSVEIESVDFRGDYDGFIKSIKRDDTPIDEYKYKTWKAFEFIPTINIEIKDDDGSEVNTQFVQYVMGVKNDKDKNIFHNDNTKNGEAPLDLSGFSTLIAKMEQLVGNNENAKVTRNLCDVFKGWLNVGTINGSEENNNSNDEPKGNVNGLNPENVASLDNISLSLNN